MANSSDRYLGYSMYAIGSGVIYAFSDAFIDHLIAGNPDPKKLGVFLGFAAFGGVMYGCGILFNLPKKVLDRTLESIIQKD